MTLSPYLEHMDLKLGEGGLYIIGRCVVLGRSFNLEMKCDRLLKRLINELLRLEPAILGGRIKIEHVKALIIALYAPPPQLQGTIRQ